jgi:hypothetical protein
MLTIYHVCEIYHVSNWFRKLEPSSCYWNFIINDICHTHNNLFFYLVFIFS